MLSQDDRKKALLYEEWSVSLTRLFAVRGLDDLLNQRPRPEWIGRGVESADRRIKEDKQAGTCGCHLCAAKQNDRQWLQGR